MNHQILIDNLFCKFFFSIVDMRDCYIISMEELSMTKYSAAPAMPKTLSIYPAAFQDCNWVNVLQQKEGFAPRSRSWNRQIFIDFDFSHLKWKLSSQGFRRCFYFWNTTTDGWTIAINFYAAGFWRLLREAAVNSNEGTCESLLKIYHSQDAYVCRDIIGNTSYPPVSELWLSKN